MPAAREAAYIRAEPARETWDATRRIPCESVQRMSLPPRPAPVARALPALPAAGGGLLDTSGFTPRWECGDWTPFHGWLHVVSDVLIFGAYVAIPLALAWFALTRRDVSFPRVVWLFVAFIFACGTVHLVEASLFWQPWYRLSGAVKAATAAVSWLTVLALWRVLPQAVRLPGLAHLSTVVESSGDAIVSMDLDGRVRSWNAGAQRLFGFTADEMVGRDARVLVPPARLAEFETQLGQVRAGGRVEPQDTLRLRRDGGLACVSQTLSPVRTPEGRLVGASAIARDLSRVRRLEQRFRTAVESAPLAMVIVDARGVITLVNRETEKLFGWTREELLGRPIELLVPERFRAGHPERRREYAGAPEARRMGAGRDLYALRRDGSEFPVEIGLNPVEGDAGAAVLAAIVDITERKRLADELRRTNERLEARVRERTEALQEQAAALAQARDDLERRNIELRSFAHVVSHDLQGPLRHIAGFVQLLEARRAEALDEEARGWIRRTVDSVRRMEALIRDLLAYSGVDERARPFARVELDAALDDALALLEGSLREAGAVLTRDPLPAVAGDRTQLMQVFLNLLGNALVYHGPRPPRVHVSARRDGARWVVSVRDEGIGIDPRHHERVFELFRRLHTPQEYPGTGIGLAICRRVVQRHGGRIWVESEPGRGADFLFTLPDGESPA